jgi:dihydrolipoamide dehydrogenase
MVMGDMEMSTDLLVIGGGPGGYGAAFRAADLGLDVILVDPRPGLGGLCLHAGCIPAKSLLHLAELIQDAEGANRMGLGFDAPRIDLTAMRAWQRQVIDTMTDGLMTLAKQRGVLFLQGKARFAGASKARLEGAEISAIRFKNAIIATGSRPLMLTGSPLVAGSRIIDSAAALTLAEIPKTLLVVGGGYVGLEIGSIYAALGSKVTLLEQRDRLLTGVDPELVAPLQQSLTDRFAEILFGVRVEDAAEDDDGVTIRFGQDGRNEQRRGEKALITIGRVPNSDDLGLDHTGVTLDSRGFITIDQRQRTADERIFAVGDAAGGAMLAHKATRQGRVAAEVIAGKNSGFDVRALPAVIYTDPQIAWCGLTEEQAKVENIPYSVRKFPWKFSGRARTLALAAGLTKLLVDPGDGRILGAGFVGRHAEGLIGEAALAIEMGALAEDLALTLHPYPSLSETEGEAAEIFLGSPVHIMPEPSKK